MTYKSRVDRAVACFHDGFNCSQAILSTYCDEFGLDEKTAMQISCGLGAGMGRLQKTCGAVAGAYLLIGLKFGKFLKDDEAAKEKTYALVRDFTKRFEERNKTTDCRELLDIDLICGDRQIATERVRELCPRMVRDAARIIEDMLFAGEITAKEER